MACKVGTAQDKHGREGVAKMRRGNRKRERERVGMVEMSVLGLLDRQN